MSSLLLIILISSSPLLVCPVLGQAPSSPDPPPEMLAGPGSLSVVAGHPARLRCLLGGLPPGRLTVVWSRRAAPGGGGAGPTVVLRNSTRYQLTRYWANSSLAAGPAAAPAAAAAAQQHTNVSGRSTSPSSSSSSTSAAPVRSYAELRIAAARPILDDGLWNCQVVEEQLMSEDGRVTVMVAPLHLTVTAPADIQLGEQENITCETSAGRPAGSLRWRINGRLLLEGEEQELAVVATGGGSSAVYPTVVRRVDGGGGQAAAAASAAGDLSAADADTPGVSDSTRGLVPPPYNVTLVSVLRLVAPNSPPPSDGTAAGPRLTVQCVLSHPALFEERVSQAAVRLIWRPRVTMHVSPSAQVPEMTSVRLRCEADAYPRQPIVWKWYRNGEPITIATGPSSAGGRADSGEERGLPASPTPSSSSSELLLPAVDWSLNGQVYSCVAANGLGEGSPANATLDVLFAPRLLAHSAYVGVDLAPSQRTGEPSGQQATGTASSGVTLRCPVLSNPAPLYTWTRRRLGQRLGSGGGPRLTIPGPLRASQLGQYECNARSPTQDGGSVLEVRLHLVARGPPRLEGTPARQQAAALGYPARLQCSVAPGSLPPPTLLVWSRPVQEGELGTADGPMGRQRTLLPSSGGRITIQGLMSEQSEAEGETPRDRAEREQESEGDPAKWGSGGGTSYLHISDVRRSDLGLYNCTVYNQYGASWRLIRLVEQDTFQLTYVVGGATGMFGFLLICLVCLMIVCGRRRRQKRERDCRLGRNGAASRGAGGTGADIGHNGSSSQKQQQQHQLQMMMRLCGGGPGGGCGSTTGSSTSGEEKKSTLPSTLSEEPAALTSGAGGRCSAATTGSSPIDLLDTDSQASSLAVVGACCADGGRGGVPPPQYQLFQDQSQSFYYQQRQLEPQPPPWQARLPGCSGRRNDYVLYSQLSAQSHHPAFSPSSPSAPLPAVPAASASPASRPPAQRPREQQSDYIQFSDTERPHHRQQRYAVSSPLPPECHHYPPAAPATTSSSSPVRTVSSGVGLSASRLLLHHDDDHHHHVDQLEDWTASAFSAAAGATGATHTRTPPATRVADDAALTNTADDDDGLFLPAGGERPPSAALQQPLYGAPSAASGLRQQQLLNSEQSLTVDNSTAAATSGRPAAASGTGPSQLLDHRHVMQLYPQSHPAKTSHLATNV